MGILGEKDLEANISQDTRELNPHLFGPQRGSEKEEFSKKNKYNAQKVEYDGIKFDSKKELARYITLKRLLDKGIIQSLELQVKYVLLENFTDSQGNRHREISYRCDFRYVQNEVTYIEDVKSEITAKSEAFRVRWRLLCHKFKDDPNIIPVIHGV